MDIASVYLNLATLLNTEIEVEGYYGEAHQPMMLFLYSVEHEPTSARILLPLYIMTSDLMKSGYNRQIRARVLVRGTLAQNARGDLILCKIITISYRNEVVISRVTMSRPGAGLRCHQSIDFVFDWPAYFQALHTPITDITYASSILSRPVLLKGYLTPFRDSLRYPDAGFMMAIENVISSSGELWRPNHTPTATDVIRMIFNLRLPGESAQDNLNRPKYIDLTHYNKIWIPKETQAYQYISLYFPSRKPGSFRNASDTVFRFAGTVALLDEAEREALGIGPMPRTHLIFTSIDYIATQRMISFERHPRDL